ncbi:MAG: hypothetical protein II404_11565 [Prevotella sp.]|nr:hypothetical protein [Prevotella sp.]
MGKKIYLLYIVLAAIMVGCTGNSDTKDGKQSVFSAGFDQTMHEADSLYNSMQFRDALRPLPATARQQGGQGRQ